MLPFIGLLQEEVKYISCLETCHLYVVERDLSIWRAVPCQPLIWVEATGMECSPYPSRVSFSYASSAYQY
jgi:hypothetical protein